MNIKTNFACADASCKKDVYIAFFVSPSPLSREFGMHERWGRTGRETHMDVFIYDVNSLNHRV